MELSAGGIIQGKNVTTVLFAEVSGRDELVRAAGGVAGWHRISDCVERLRWTAQSSGGRVVKVIGSQIMVLFDTPDKAANAASEMHAAVNALPPVKGAKLSVKVGYHAGPVIEACDDLLGDTVKLAAALLRKAQRGQTMTTQQTAKLLSEPSRANSTQIYAMPLASSAAEAGSPKMPTEPQVRRPIPRARTMLRLTYGSETARCWRDVQTVVIGRGSGCGLVIVNELASRRHCTIRLEESGFVIRDHSSNGTYLTNEGSEEVLLLEGDEAPLAAHGWIAFGHPRALVTDVLEFTGH